MFDTITENHDTTATFEDFAVAIAMYKDCAKLIADTKHSAYAIFSQIKEEFPIFDKDLFVPDADWHPAIAIMGAIEALDRKATEEDELPW